MTLAKLFEAWKWRRWRETCQNSDAGCSLLSMPMVGILRKKRKSPSNYYDNMWFRLCYEWVISLNRLNIIIPSLMQKHRISLIVDWLAWQRCFGSDFDLFLWWNKIRASALDHAGRDMAANPHTYSDRHENWQAEREHTARPKSPISLNSIHRWRKYGRYSNTKPYAKPGTRRKSTVALSTTSRPSAWG